MPDPDTLVVDPSNADQARAWDGPDGDYWAEHADRFDRSMAGHQPAFLAAAAVTPGDRVLDVGCGTGQTTRAAARLAGAGHALGVDLSERMIELARRRAAGLPGALFLRADAQRHPFRPGGADVAISRTGAMFFGDPPAAFANVARALRPGGRLVLLTWQPAARNEWFRAFWTALTGHARLPSPPPGTPGPFALSEPDRVRALLHGAGFTDVRVTARDADLDYGPDAESAHRFLLGLLGWMLREHADPERGRAALLRSLHEHLGPDGVRYRSAAWLITAHRREDQR